MIIKTLQFLADIKRGHVKAKTLHEKVIHSRHPKILKYVWKCTDKDIKRFGNVKIPNIPNSGIPGDDFDHYIDHLIFTKSMHDLMNMNSFFLDEIHKRDMIISNHPIYIRHFEI